MSIDIKKTKVPNRLKEIISHQFDGLNLIESLIYFFYLLLCLILPVSKVPVAPIIGIMLLLSIIRISSKKNTRIVLPGLISASIIFLYLLYIAGLIYTSDTKRGLFDLEVKLSFIIIPLIFMFSGKNIFSEKRIQTLKLIFVTGVFISTIVSLIHSTYVSIETYFTFDNFMYNRLSWAYHPSYNAMYLTTSILILFLYLMKKWNKLSTSLKMLLPMLILYFFVFIIFLNSKMGMLMSGFVLLILLIYMIISKRNFLLGLISLLIIFMVSAFVISRTPYLSSRISSAWQSFRQYKGNKTTTNDGTTNRLLVWNYASKVAAGNLPLGVGTGDVRSELNAAYSENGFAEGLKLNLNAHNQFLQTFVAIGIPGLVVLIMVFIFMLISGIKSKKIYIILFTIILLCNFLVESMFETQAGVVFTIFFICLYDFHESKKLNNTSYIAVK